MEAVIYFWQTGVAPMEDWTLVFTLSLYLGWIVFVGVVMETVFNPANPRPYRPAWLQRWQRKRLPQLHSEATIEVDRTK